MTGLEEVQPQAGVCTLAALRTSKVSIVVSCKDATPVSFLPIRSMFSLARSTLRLHVSLAEGLVREMKFQVVERLEGSCEVSVPPIRRLVRILTPEVQVPTLVRPVGMNTIVICLLGRIIFCLVPSPVLAGRHLLGTTGTAPRKNTEILYWRDRVSIAAFTEKSHPLSGPCTLAEGLREAYGLEPT